ncbi:recombinase family protein [Bacillus pseudomycoides]|uniref:recombinase family protein n=1 Tax=Bacillus pseudomycoides TaxID=64104 RepID=UPI000BED2390|nr:recombinase family protein [Bacillus pseudomycoides]PEB42238.1 recombinase [Bacillus pseudomycoides]PGA62197.1 recombinase [Bacillus pseudomycoides]
MLVGYARVSTKEQNESRQIEALKKAGCEKIFLDKVSGKNFDRPEYQKMKGFLRFKDTIVVEDLSRFGRNKKEIMDEWSYFQENEVDIYIINMPILDTRKFKGMPSVGNLISEVVLTVLSWTVQEERERILEHQRQGIEIAKKNGVYKGRKPQYTEDNPSLQHALELYSTTKMPLKKICEITKISRNTLYKKIKEFHVQKRTD